MVQLNLQHFVRAAPISARGRKPLGAYLIGRGLITASQLDRALAHQYRQRASLGEILVSEGFITRSDVMQVVAEQNQLQFADLTVRRPDNRLCSIRSVDFWLAHHCIPWKQVGQNLLVATANPDLFDAVKADLSDSGYKITPVLATTDQIDQAISEAFSQTLAAAAETRVAEVYSCRSWTPRARAGPALILAAFCALFATFFKTGMMVLLVAAVGSLVLFLTLRIVGLVAFLSGKASRSHILIVPDKPLPRMSIMVPLYKEREIADALIKRLRRLSYPKALLDVILVLEEADDITRDTVANVNLPNWIRTIEVPALNGLTTKPRAMNYALDFCRGDIVGVWDAEDAPQPDQLERVAARFAEVDDDVVCLQGILDYYNPRSNWRSRCFTIEYSSWFRVILQGIARLGLVVPLGGTTFFFRRDKLLELGGWDAHNVTEDADLGVRLFRAGYRTEMVNTTTFEEANFRAWPWVKQRSRWLKGFMVTYLVQMRSPSRLLQDLGWARFLGVQAFFLGTIGQFLLAPVLWAFWLIVLQLPAAMGHSLPQKALLSLTAVFLLAEMINILIGALAVWAPERRFLMLWLPLMPLYYPLGVIAAYKALWELVSDPFYWDKTQHGHAMEEEQPQ